MSASMIAPSAIIELVMDPLSPVVTNVPDTSGIEIVLSLVGLTTDSVVSKAFAELPSNVILPLFK